MRRPSLFTRNNKRLSLAAASFVPLGLLALLVLRLGGCTENSSTGSGVDRNPSSQVQPAGEEFLISVLDEVDAISRTVAHDIRNQYTIGYKPTTPKSAGGYRTIKVDARAHGYNRLTVRTKSGYYAGQERAASGTH